MDQTCGSVRSSTTGTGATGNGRVGSCRDNIPPLLWREEMTARKIAQRVQQAQQQRTAAAAS